MEFIEIRLITQEFEIGKKKHVLYFEVDDCEEIDFKGQIFDFRYKNKSGILIKCKKSEEARMKEKLITYCKKRLIKEKEEVDQQIKLLNKM